MPDGFFSGLAGLLSEGLSVAPAASQLCAEDVKLTDIRERVDARGLGGNVTRGEEVGVIA